jgi:hypothetical protein
VIRLRGTFDNYGNGLSSGVDGYYSWSQNKYITSSGKDVSHSHALSQYILPQSYKFDDFVFDLRGNSTDKYEYLRGYECNGDYCEVKEYLPKFNNLDQLVEFLVEAKVPIYGPMNIVFFDFTVNGVTESSTGSIEGLHVELINGSSARLSFSKNNFSTSWQPYYSFYAGFNYENKAAGFKVSLNSISFSFGTKHLETSMLTEITFNYRLENYMQTAALVAGYFMVYEIYTVNFILKLMKR